MRFRPELFNSRSRTSAAFTSAVTSVAILAVLGGLAVQPSLLGRGDAQPVAAAGDSYDGFDTNAAEQLREDQCVAVDALRKGGPSLFALAQNALGLPADQLHQKLRRGGSMRFAPGSLGPPGSRCRPAI